MELTLTTNNYTLEYGDDNCDFSQSPAIQLNGETRKGVQVFEFIIDDGLSEGDWLKLAQACKEGSRHYVGWGPDCGEGSISVDASETTLCAYARGICSSRMTLTSQSCIDAFCKAATITRTWHEPLVCHKCGTQANRARHGWASGPFHADRGYVAPCEQCQTLIPAADADV